MIGCVGATFWAAAHAEWEARVAPGDGLDVMSLGRHPVWTPQRTPEEFTYQTRSHRTESRPIRPGEVVASSFRPTAVALEASVLAWPVTSVVGVLYVALRGRRRDFALHCAGTIAIGQCAALVACAASVPWWISIGGWPHLPQNLLAVGFVTGAVTGLLTYSPAVVGGPTYLRPTPRRPSR